MLQIPRQPDHNATGGEITEYRNYLKANLELSDKAIARLIMTGNSIADAIEDK